MLAHLLHGAERVLYGDRGLLERKSSLLRESRGYPLPGQPQGEARPTAEWLL